MIAKPPIIYWLYGERVVTKKLAGCICLRNLGFLSGIGRGRTACSEGFGAFGAALVNLDENLTVSIGQAKSPASCRRCSIIVSVPEDTLFFVDFAQAPREERSSLRTKSFLCGFRAVLNAETS
jgi:hypothetical protein